jgi:hypothetical protein
MGCIYPLGDFLLSILSYLFNKVNKEFAGLFL